MMQTEPSRHIPWVFALFWGALLAAAGYGATFVLTRHFIALGGSEIDTGYVLAVAVVGTFVSLPMTGSFAISFGAARCAAIGVGLVALAFALLAQSETLDALGLFGGFALGCGWGTFYLAAPMALSRLAEDTDRAYWFLRFGAFQMAGIGLSPVLGEFMVTRLGMSTRGYFLVVAASCCLACLLLFAFDRRTRRMGPTGRRADLSWLRDIGAVFRSPSITPIVMVALGAAAFGGVMTFQSSIVRGAALSPSTYFAVYTVTVVIARWLLAAPVNRLPSRISIPALIATMVVGLCLLFGAGSDVIGSAAHFGSAALFGIGYGLAYPLIQACAVNDVGDPALQNAALTWFVIFYFAGLFGFPFLGGWIVVSFGVEALIVGIIFAGAVELALAFRIGRRFAPQMVKRAGPQ
jgi:MFS family permease